MRRIAVIIPARFGSQRLPGKPLADLAGRPLIAHVVDRARRARGVDIVAVATDDERIAHAVEAAGGRAIVTGEAQTGTDRVAQAARTLRPEADVVVNLQGDEPLMDPAAIETLAGAMVPGVEMATLARPLAEGEMGRLQVVKVVTDLRGDALYFSRAPIPFRRRSAANGFPPASTSSPGSRPGGSRRRSPSSSSGRSSTGIGSGSPRPPTRGSASTRRRTSSGLGRSSRPSHRGKGDVHS